MSVTALVASAAIDLAAHQSQASGAEGSPDTLLRGGIVATSGPVVSLAADGSRAAAAIGKRDGWCTHVVTWDISRRTVTAYWPTFCAKSKKLPTDSRAYWSDVVQVAVAGDRAAWIRTLQPGTYFLQCIETASMKDPRVRSLVGRCDDDFTRFSVTAGDGTWATNIVGSGQLLVFNAWSSCVNDPSVIPNCLDVLKHEPNNQPPPSGNWHYAVASGALMRITATAFQQIATGTETLYAVSADGGRVLVLRSKPNCGKPNDWWSRGADGSLAIYTSRGQLAKTLTVNLGVIRTARMQGRLVAALTNDAVVVLDASTGQTVRTWPLPHAPTSLQDIHDGVIVTVTGHTIDLRRVSDGKRATIIAPGRAVLAQLERPGLFYSYTDRSGTGRIAFATAASLAARFGR